MVKAIIIEFLKVLFMQWCPDGCLRRTVQQQQPGHIEQEPTSRPPMVEPSPPGHAGPHGGPYDHKQPCTQEEIYRTRCLNGGQCVAIELNNGLRDIGCSCTTDWVGDRCQYVFIDPDILAVQQENMRTANIAAGVSVCILIVFVVLLSVYVYLRYKRKERLLHRRDAEYNNTGHLFIGHQEPLVEKVQLPPDSQYKQSHAVKEVDVCNNHTPWPDGAKDKLIAECEVYADKGGSGLQFPTDTIDGSTVRQLADDIAQVPPVSFNTMQHAAAAQPSNNVPTLAQSESSSISSTNFGNGSL